jgi:hypothetical protein
MARKVIVSIVVWAAVCMAFAPAASAATPIRLYLSQGAAFSLLGHSCGGIQEHVYATGFASNGYPTGDVYMSTSCGGSGKGGGHSTTYSGWASTVWTWLGETRSSAALSGAATENGSFSQTDSHGDHLYNEGSAAYLQTGEPPLQAPAAPEGVSASVGLYESGETEFLRLGVNWTPAPETAGLLTTSIVTATPVLDGAPVLTSTVSSYWSSAYLSPVQPNTVYRVTVTNTDAEGTSPPSTPIEIKSPSEDGEAEKEKKTVETCAQSDGTIRLSPGLSEVARAQKITVTGELTGCEGPLGVESGTYVDRLKTTAAVTCSVLASSSIEPDTSPLSLAVKWAPGEEGASKGLLVLPLSEVSLTGVTGTFEGGPFGTPASVTATSVAESFTGSTSCGQAVGNKKAKPVKDGSFSTSEVEFG